MNPTTKLQTSHTPTHTALDHLLERNEQGIIARRASRIPLSLLSIGVAICTAASTFAETYTLTQINPPAGAVSSSANGLNSAGQVVGRTTVKSGRSEVGGPAFVWANGIAQALPSYSTGSAGANSISDSGLIVGNSAGPGAVWWQPTGSGGYTIGSWDALLPAGSTLHLVDAVAISRDGQFILFDQVDTASGHDQAAVGQVASVGGAPVAFSGLWLIDSLDGSVSSDGFISAGLSITHDGNGIVRVAGYAQHQSASARAFLWVNNVVSGSITLTDLDPTQTSFSTADSANNNGEAAGNIGYPGSQAVFWNASGVKQSVPPVSGTRSYATSLNDAGSVVGWSQRSGKNATNHAFIWSANIGIRDLNTLKSVTDTSGIELTNASEIVNSGGILARGLKKGVGVDVLLRLVP